MSEGQEQLSWFDQACKQLTEVIPSIGTRTVDVLTKLGEVVPKVGRMCDHVSVLIPKLIERLDKPVEVRFDQAQLKQAVDDYGEMIATVAEVAVLRVDVGEGKVSTPTYTHTSAKYDVPAETLDHPEHKEVPSPKTNLVVEASKAPNVAENSPTTAPDHPVVHAIMQEVMAPERTTTSGVPLVDLSVLAPKGDCADCTAIGMLCEVHVKDQAVVDDAMVQVSSWLDDRDADGSLGREPLLKHFKRLDFATKAMGDKCDRDCMSCERVTDAGIPRPVQCLRDVAKLVPAVSG